jgi:peptidoglycan/xylan/chitin deacetylase (PgdA/CDA1 family)
MIPATPVWLQKLFPDILWKVQTEEKILYLTFDDGPVPGVTDEILKILSHYQAHATFFCVGENVEKYPNLFHSIRAEGHSVGNHTYSHKNGYRTSTDEYLKDVRRGFTVTQSRLFRPPYGKLKPSQYRILKKDVKICLWDVLAEDYNVAYPTKRICNKIVKQTGGGSIIVLHDSEKCGPRVLEILPFILNYYSGSGYSFKSLPES